MYTRKLLISIFLFLSSLNLAIAGDSINLNTADAETLEAALDGVGAAKAQAIVEYRESKGGFVAIDELSEVKGIGEKTVEKNRARIRLD